MCIRDSGWTGRGLRPFHPPAGGGDGPCARHDRPGHGAGRGVGQRRAVRRPGMDRAGAGAAVRAGGAGHLRAGAAVAYLAARPGQRHGRRATRAGVAAHAGAGIARGRTLRDAGRPRGAFRERRLCLWRVTPGIVEHQLHAGARHRDGRRRDVGRGQVHAGAAAAAVLRSGRRAHHAGRGGPAAHRDLSLIHIWRSAACASKPPGTPPRPPPRRRRAARRARPGSRPRPARPPARRRWRCRA